MKDLPKEIFEQKPNKEVVHSTLVWYLASRRRGTQSTKTRAEVRGGGVKPWKQKGTGRARAGSIRSPLWRKGGVTFGPKPRDYSYALPKKIRKLALKVVLSEKARDSKVVVTEALQLKEKKTKLAVAALKALKVSGKTLVLLAKDNEIFLKSARNLKGVVPMMIDDFNIHELLKADWVVIEKKAIADLKEVLA
jgi:large subunit ribosomal protein L4